MDVVAVCTRTNKAQTRSALSATFRHHFRSGPPQLQLHAPQFPLVCRHNLRIELRRHLPRGLGLWMRPSEITDPTLQPGRRHVSVYVQSAQTRRLSASQCVVCATPRHSPVCATGRIIVLDLA